MRWLWLSVAAITIGAASFYLWNNSSHEISVLDMRDANEVSIVLTDNGFEPPHLRIKEGTTVVFSTTRAYAFWPASNLHPSHELYSAFDPKQPINPGVTWSFVFDKAGTWDFHDHVRSYFTGTIYVD